MALRDVAERKGEEQTFESLIEDSSDALPRVTPCVELAGAQEHEAQCRVVEHLDGQRELVFFRLTVLEDDAHRIWHGVHKVEHLEAAQHPCASYIRSRVSPLKPDFLPVIADLLTFVRLHQRLVDCLKDYLMFGLPGIVLDLRDGEDVVSFLTERWVKPRPRRKAAEESRNAPRLDDLLGVLDLRQLFSQVYLLEEVTVGLLKGECLLADLRLFFLFFRRELDLNFCGVRSIQGIPVDSVSRRLT